MSSSGYDFASNQYTPEGRIFQIEYAQTAVSKSGTVIGLRGEDCVVLAVEKILSSRLYEDNSNKRIATINKTIGFAVAGFVPDARTVLDIARREAAEYRICYKDDIPLEALKTRIACYIHTYTVLGPLRPFGVGVILASYEDDGPHLYSINASGETNSCFGCVFGKASADAKSEMCALNLSHMTHNELVREAAKIIYLVHDAVKDRIFELELSWVGRHTRGKHSEVPRYVFEDAVSYAKSAINEEDIL